MINGSRLLAEKLNQIKEGTYNPDGVVEAVTDETPHEDSVYQSAEEQVEEHVEEQGEEPKFTHNVEEIEQSAGQQEGEPQEYVPNLKFKVYDEEKEFDEFLKPYVNKDNEEQFRDILTKAYGLDGVKSKLEKTRDDLSHKEQAYSGLENGVKQLQSLLDNKKYGDVFRALKIDDEDLFDYASERLNYRDLPPEEKSKIDLERQVELENQRLKQQNEELYARQEEEKFNRHEREVSLAMQSPNVQQHATAFDKKFGEGSFRDEIQQVGLYHYKKTGKDISPAEAAERVINKYGFTGGGESAGTQRPADTRNVDPSKITTKVNTKNTITNHAASGSSAVKKEFTSLQQLRDHANDLFKRRAGA